MPFKSQAQRRKFGKLVSEGKMKQSVFDTWNEETGNKKLPEKATQKSTSKGAIRGVRKTR